jgi:hypothetical protein
METMVQDLRYALRVLRNNLASRLSPSSPWRLALAQHGSIPVKTACVYRLWLCLHVATGVGVQTRLVASKVGR